MIANREFRDMACNNSVSMFILIFLNVTIGDVLFPCTLSSVFLLYSCTGAEKAF